MEEIAVESTSAYQGLIDVTMHYESLLQECDDEIYDLKVRLADAAILLAELVDDYRKAERFNPHLIREGQPREIWDRAVELYTAATGSDGNWGEYKSWDQERD